MPPAPGRSKNCACMNALEIAKQSFREYYDANVATLREAEELLRGHILTLLADHPSFTTPHVVSRIKAREECIAKFQRKYLPKLPAATMSYEIRHFISDLVGVRVICLHEPDIDEVARLLEQEFSVLAVVNKGREVRATAHAFRYKALHLNLALPGRHRRLPAYSRFPNLTFEVQVRTAIQDAWSTLEHAMRYKKKLPHELSRRINALAALCEIADREFLAIRNQIAALDERSPSGAARPAASTPTVQGLLAVLQKHFPHSKIGEGSLCALAVELGRCRPPVTVPVIDAALMSEKVMLREFARYQWHRYRLALNPITLACHALYLHDPASYQSLLLDAQRMWFNRWRRNRTREGNYELSIGAAPPTGE